ncbi:hypothetical protein FA95DRAFT_625174 [Auriscalpium vulgare]|uniref:Uncharacterized protein n=1 Tax=Auriscalpium vulgare TaxID=40419 RepID=A0ACB8REC9_9AGAM|nr:hypothetical protein FA95DRAFT_625174 [Auriscalpium vulgare]
MHVARIAAEQAATNQAHTPTHLVSLSRNRTRRFPLPSPRLRRRLTSLIIYAVDHFLPGDRKAGISECVPAGAYILQRQPPAYRGHSGEVLREDAAERGRGQIYHAAQSGVAGEGGRALVCSVTQWVEFWTNYIKLDRYMRALPTSGLSCCQTNTKCSACA